MKMHFISSGTETAVTAAERGLAVVLLDEQREPGGQIYRAIGSTPVTATASGGSVTARRPSR